MTFEEIQNEVSNLKENRYLSDGYHTFDELYTYRELYNALLFRQWFENGLYDVHKSLRHSDGELCFGGGWFIVMAETPNGQITNHYKVSEWKLFDIPEREKANTYNGHTPKDVEKTLKELVLEKSSSMEKLQSYISDEDIEKLKELTLKNKIIWRQIKTNNFVSLNDKNTLAILDEYWIVNDLPFQKVNKDLMQAIKDQIEKSESLYRIKFKKLQASVFKQLVNELDNKNDLKPAKVAQPSHCFKCGGQLREKGLGFLECIECSSVFLPSVLDKEGIIQLEHIRI